RGIIADDGMICPILVPVVHPKQEFLVYYPIAGTPQEYHKCPILLPPCSSLTSRSHSVSDPTGVSRTHPRFSSACSLSSMVQKRAAFPSRRSSTWMTTVRSPKALASSCRFRRSPSQRMQFSEKAGTVRSLDQAWTSG